VVRLRNARLVDNFACISFVCVEIFEFMDTGKPSLEKGRELVSWTNSIKSNDSSSKLGTTDLSSFQEFATSSPIRSSIANKIGPCAFA
jgi:hypothetical protein